MLAYVLPGNGIYGGVKKGFHCADALNAAAHPCVVATPDGTRPTWFDSHSEVMTHAALASRCTPDDTVLFSCPADAPFIDSLPARRKVVHMQGASTEADRALFHWSRGYTFISHGLHMTYELQRAGRVGAYVPMGIPDVFRWRGEARTPLSIAAMPRKGAAILRLVQAALPAGCTFTPIDGVGEAEVARILRQTDIFLAVSTGEALGLPPLEAMCAGCCVVGFPGIGGYEFMRHMDTAHVVPNGDVPGLIDALRHVSAQPAYRDALRERARSLSAAYTMERERIALLRALGLDGGAA